MRRSFKILLGVSLALVALAAVPAQRLYGEFQKAKSEDPTVWAEDIAALEAATHGRTDAVVFIGSSSIRLWPELERDMAPLPVVQHGFGGAKLADIEHYAERLVNAYRPRAVVVFAGSNDLQPGATKPASVLADTYLRFVARVRADLPNVPIYFIGITPTPLRFEIWEEAQETNRRIRDESEARADLHYIETGPTLLGPDGHPERANYRFDGLHLSERGYAIWTRIIRPRLLEDLGGD